MHGQLVAVLDGADDLVDVGEIDPRIDALREEIEAQRHQADIAGALAVAEETALDALRTRHQPQLRGGDAAAAVVVRMQRQHDRIAARQVPRHPLDLVGVDVGRGHFHGRRQVDDHPVVRRGQPDVVHRIADFDREVELGAGEALRRILVDPVRLRLCRRAIADDRRTRDRDGLDAPTVETEHHAPLRRRRRVVEVHDRALRTPQRLERALDQRLARLREHLHGDVVGNEVLLDQLAREIEIRLRRGRKPDLDFLVAQLDQQPEHAQLALGVHRLDQRLVAVAQVDAAPHRRLGDHARRPRAVAQGHRREWLVLGRRVDGHGTLSGWKPSSNGSQRNRPRCSGGRCLGPCSNCGRGFMCARGAAEAADRRRRAQAGTRKSVRARVAVILRQLIF